MSHLAERRQEEKERRRDAILEAAAAVAAEHGFAEFTMEQVARKARLSRALLYVYFRDKEDLLMGLADRANTLLAARFMTIRAKRHNGLNMMKALGRAYVAFADDSPAYFEAMARFAATEPDTKDKQTNTERCLQSGDRIFELLVQVLELGIRDGSIRRDIGPPLHAALTLWGFMHGIIQLTSTKGEVLAHKGASAAQLIESALLLSTHALRQPVAKKR